MPADIVRYLKMEEAGRSAAKLENHLEDGFDGAGAMPMHSCTSLGTL